ncbi:MAG TPA: hypothetical protein VN048_04360 [Verrucomicrobiae bacterium]|nr:hypothetical protein [Verrucomicrobiae bacterium]
MNSKRSFRIALYVSLGFMALGCAGMALATPDLVPDQQEWVIYAGKLPILLGAIGFVASLAWWFIAGRVTGIHSRQQNHAEKN